MYHLERTHTELLARLMRDDEMSPLVYGSEAQPASNR